VGTSAKRAGHKERVNEGKYDGCILYSYIKIRRMKSVEIVLRMGGGGRGRMLEGISLRYIVSTYVNITLYPPVQLLYVNKKKRNETIQKNLNYKAFISEHISLSIKTH
jgi:hypothetical protein